MKLTKSELSEEAFALKEIGWPVKRIAKHLNVGQSSVYRWLSEVEQEIPPENIASLREKRREQFIGRAWDRVEALDLVIKGFIDEGKEGFRSAKEATTCMGIYADKISGFEARRQGANTKQMMVFNIHPPEGYIESRPDRDTIQVCDIGEAVYGVDSGGGGGEDIRALPEGRPDGE